MKNTCFLAPIHRKGFSYGYEYVKSYNKYFDDDHLYLVFSNQEEMDEFKRNIGSSTRYRSILCTEKLLCTKPISQKKLFGVDHVFKNSSFENVAVTDVDCVFINSLDYDTLIQERIDGNKLYVSKSNNPGIVEKVGKDAANRFFSTSDVTILEKITNNFTHYFWFNDIPVYTKNRFYSFLQYINYPESIKKLEYTTFDFILYSYYLLIKNEIKLEIISVDGVHPPVQDKGSFVEAQKHFNPEYFKSAVEKIKPMWLCNPIESSNKDLMMKLHVDRN